MSNPRECSHEFNELRVCRLCHVAEEDTRTKTPRADPTPLKPPAVPEPDCTHPALDKDGKCAACGWKPEEERAPIFAVDFSQRGWMKIQVNLMACSEAQELVDQFSGFWERMRLQGFQIIKVCDEQRRQTVQAVAQQQKRGQKQGFRGFVNRKMSK